MSFPRKRESNYFFIQIIIQAFLFLIKAFIHCIIFESEEKWIPAFGTVEKAYFPRNPVMPSRIWLIVFYYLNPFPGMPDSRHG
jgi:hypothetical protein